MNVRKISYFCMSSLYAFLSLTGSAQCSQGKRYRQRSYVNPMAASQANCKKSMTMRQVCYGTNCDDNIDVQTDTEDDDMDTVDPDCALTVRKCFLH